ncbi:hypothetical protein Syun_017717 [Stephania yunnanensis]|uniref:Uncharacterized protein n=1 Tax=Stephania yunnanensis TaxID=152371 RepID=A0AAP0P5D6_9MAGN
MGSVSGQYPFGNFVKEKLGVLDTDYGFLRTSCYCPLRGEALELLNLYSRSVSFSSSKRLIVQVSALPDVGDFFWEKAATPILDMVENPKHLKNLSAKELKQLADEIRSELSFITSKIRRPFKASLAVVELTVAIHYVFNAPKDKILWDVGGQIEKLRLEHIKLVEENDGLRLEKKKLAEEASYAKIISDGSQKSCLII